MCDREWKSISVGDKEYLIRSSERDGRWKVYLTNLIEIWTEDLDKKKIVHKCEELNPNLCMEDMDVHKFVSQILKDIPKHAVKVSVEQIELSKELEGNIFEFAVDLTRGSSVQLWDEVTMPLCLATGELRRRQTILLDLVKRKDAEILEYRLNGAELIRKHIRTESFNENLFEKNIPNQNLDSCHDVFKTIMELRGVKLERWSSDNDSDKIGSKEASNSREASIKIEAEKLSEGHNSDLVIGNDSSSNIDGNLTSETFIQSSTMVVPKEESSSPSKTSPSPKSLQSAIKIDADKKIDTPKRTQSVSTSPIKRTKKDIYDFIR